MRRAALLLGVLVACGGSKARAPAATTPASGSAPATSAARTRAPYKCPPGRASSITVVSEEAPVPLVLPEKKKRKRDPHAVPPPEPATVVVRDVVWGPDDASILLVTERSDSTGTLEASASVVDLATGSVRAVLDARSGSRSPYGQRFEYAEWSADGALIGIVRSDAIALWDGRSVTAGNAAPAFVIDGAPLIEADDRKLAFAPVGHSFATWHPTVKQLRFYDGRDNSKPVRTVTLGADTPKEVEEMTFSPDGTRLAVAVGVVASSQRHTQIDLYDPASGALVTTLHGESSPRYDVPSRVTSLHWTPKGRGIVTVDSIGRAHVWSAMSDDPPTTLLEMGFTGPSALVESGNILLVGGGTLATFDLRARKIIHDIPGDATTIERVRPNRAQTVVALPREDRVDLHRFSDNAHLTLRLTPTGVLLHSDSGLHAGARDGFAQLRATIEGSVTRPLKADEATYRPTLAQDFLASCPMTP